MNEPIDIMDIIEYGMRKEQLKEENPEKFKKIEEYLSDTQNKEKYFYTLENNNSKQSKNQNPPQKKIKILLALAASILFCWGSFLLISKAITENNTGHSFSIYDRESNSSYLLSIGLLGLSGLVSYLYYRYSNKKQ